MLIFKSLSCGLGGTQLRVSGGCPNSWRELLFLKNGILQASSISHASSFTIVSMAKISNSGSMASRVAMVRAVVGEWKLNRTRLEPICVKHSTTEGDRRKPQKEI